MTEISALSGEWTDPESKQLADCLCNTTSSRRTSNADMFLDKPFLQSLSQPGMHLLNRPSQTAAQKTMDQICSPLPDELAKSHLIRLQRINAIATPSQALRQLSSSGYDPVPARRLALAVGACPDVYIHRHTFLTYWMSSRAPGNMANVGGEGSWRSRDGLLSLTAPAPSLSFCPKCAAQDIDILGFSYWRRGHQLVGATYCLQHQIQLSLTAHGAPKTSSLPHEHQYVTAHLDLRLTAAQRRAVCRYQDLGEALVARKNPISPTYISLGHWVHSRLNPVDRSAMAEELHRHCLATFGVNWLQQMWSANTKRNCLKSISRRLKSAVDWMNPSIEVFTLIATALTATTQEAVAVLESLSNDASVGGGSSGVVEASS